MRTFGVSTGAVAFGDWRGALKVIAPLDLRAVEVSALRESELPDLASGIDRDHAGQYSYVAVHAPSRLERLNETEVVDLLAPFTRHGWNIVVHPDVVSQPDVWRRLGASLCIENMDNRKCTGRTASELDEVFNALPEAMLCFDIAHAEHVDATMQTAHELLERHRHRIAHVHISELTSGGEHRGLSMSTVSAFRRVAHLIPEDAPVILETLTPRAEAHEQRAWLKRQMDLSEQALEPMRFEMPATV